MSEHSQYVLADDVSHDPWTDQPDRPVEADDPSTTDAITDPSLEEVLQVVFDIGVGEREVYRALAARECGSTGDLADELDRCRSNVSRYLNRLFQKGLVTRRRRILQSGGHVYQYSARSPEEVRRLLRAGLEQWSGAANDHIETLVADAESEAAASAGGAGEAV